MSRRFSRRFNHLVHDVLRRGPIRVAHAEVDDVFSARTSRRLHLAGDVEDIRREAFQPQELLHWPCSYGVTGYAHTDSPHLPALWQSQRYAQRLAFRA